MRSQVFEQSLHAESQYGLHRTADVAENKVSVLKKDSAGGKAQSKRMSISSSVR